jgi:hypothetical protein
MNHKRKRISREFPMNTTLVGYEIKDAMLSFGLEVNVMSKES